MDASDRVSILPIQKWSLSMDSVPKYDTSGNFKQTVILDFAGFLIWAESFIFFVYVLLNTGLSKV